MDIETMQNLFMVLTRDIHKMERIAKETPAFKGATYPLKSPRLQICINEIENARMCMGDCLRLIVMGDDARTSMRFIPAEHGATSEDSLTIILSNTNEKEVILDMKSHLRDILYRAVDANANVYVSELDCKPNEFKLYFQMAQIALKKADQQLGLRLSEI